MDPERQKVCRVRSIGVVYGQGLLHLLQSLLETDEVVSEVVHVRMRANYNLWNNKIVILVLQ